MSKNHYRSLSAVFPVILREKDGRTEVLLHRRANTGYMDDMWDTAGSGHVDQGETATHAVIRECGEELGIRVKAEDLTFAHLSHNVATVKDDTYYNMYFFVQKFEGEPSIREPQKCSGMTWFDVEQLPENMIAVRRADVLHCLRGEPYSEYVDERL